MQQSAEGIGFAIPVATAKAVLDQIISHGLVIRGWFGAEYADAAMANPGKTPPQHGVIVLEVRPGGPAATAGLRAGDLLLKLDGDEIADQADLRSHEAALAPGKVARLEGTRDGTPFAIELTLMQRPSNDVAGT
jgi:serine protease DegS/serine protease DegQ